MASACHSLPFFEWQLPKHLEDSSHPQIQVLVVHAQVNITWRAQTQAHAKAEFICESLILESF